MTCYYFLFFHGYLTGQPPQLEQRTPLQGNLWNNQQRNMLYDLVLPKQRGRIMYR
jgi:hypothetical protein